MGPLVVAGVDVAWAPPWPASLHHVHWSLAPFVLLVALGQPFPVLGVTDRDCVCPRMELLSGSDGVSAPAFSPFPSARWNPARRQLPRPAGSEPSHQAEGFRAVPGGLRRCRAAPPQPAL